MKKVKTNDMVAISMVSAILCMIAPISINLPISPVPITLATYAVLLAGIILGRWKGTLCVLVYILLGGVGLPVFSNYTGGMQKILGPSGGYLIGYLFMAWITGFFVEKSAGKIYFYFVGAIIGTAACYMFGTIWLGAQLHMTFAQALWAGVIPFLPLDMIKIVMVVISCYPVRKALIRQNLISVSA